MKSSSRQRERLAALRPVLELRQRLLQTIRAHFTGAGFLEVETPVRIAAPALEPHIDAQPAGPAWLRTSPELHMKRLLAAGYERIFQLGPCFRRGELGRHHHPEFTMLEWYRAHADYHDALRDTEALLNAVAAVVPAATRLRLAPPWPCWTVREVFQRWAGWDPVAAFDEERFYADLVAKVEPNLPRDQPVVLMDYPAQAAALARLKPGQPEVAERWELYLGEVELANAFSELTDPDEQRRRFVECAARRRAAGQEVYPLDEAFLAALEQGSPPAAGVALGVDRLLMVLSGAPTLDEVLPFRDETS